MGLQNQLSDVSSESFPILVVILIANCVGYLRSLTFTLFQSVGFSSPRFDTDRIDYGLCDAFGSGLGGLIVLSEQLNLNRLFSYTFDDDDSAGSGSECVVCLNRLCDGEKVRKLDCRHVFHKECFDGWLDTCNFNCPICRSSLVSDERVDLARRRVATDVLAWFTMT